MGINIGAFFAPLVDRLPRRDASGWHWGFAAAGVGMLLGLIRYLAGAGRTLGTIGLAAGAHPDPAAQARQERSGTLALAIGLARARRRRRARADRRRSRIDPQAVGESMVYVLVGARSSPSSRYVFIAGGLNARREAAHRRHLRAVRLRRDLLVRVRAGADVAEPVRARLHRPHHRRLRGAGAAGSSRSMRSFIILLAPVFARDLGRPGASAASSSSSPAKFALGLAARGRRLRRHGAGRQHRRSTAAARVSVSAWWLTVSYLFQTLGELCAQPGRPVVDDEAGAAHATSAR